MMHPSKTVIVSERGHPLMHQEMVGVPVVTVENYEKWYSIYVIMPDGKVEAIPTNVVLEIMGDNGWWIDHRWHPSLLLALAKHYNGEVPTTTLEVVAGRWILEGSLVKGIEYGFEDITED